MSADVRIHPGAVASRSESHAHAVAVVLQLQAGLVRQSRIFALRAARDRARRDLAAAEEALAVEEAEHALESKLTQQMIDMARMRFVAEASDEAMRSEEPTEA